MKRDQAKDDLFEAYLSDIKTLYNSGGALLKKEILDGLDALVEDFENPDYNGGSEAIRRTNRNSAFDGLEAKNIRVSSRLSQKALAEQLGLHKKYGTERICKYETGAIKPSNPPRGKYARAYMGWLKSSGYNPFGL